jgi:Fe-S oxidoreductase
MQGRAAMESLVFIVLLFLSIALFWRRFGRVLSTIRASKADADFKLRPLGRRFGGFVWEVLLQGKVIRERPLPGIAHALVFWGFCAFALITIDHFAGGVGLDLLSPHGIIGRIAAIFAIAVMISIAALAFRRFIVRPKWLGPVSLESGLIAFLIFALMATYLMTYIVGETTVAGRVNWWLHTLALLTFLPLIPHTKHLHLVLSPATVFLRRGSFSQIPPLAGDEDFGLDTGKDVSRLVALQAYTCVECGRCTEHCPASNTGKILNPKQVILGARDYLNEFGTGGEEPLLGKHISMEAAFQCTTCGACEYQCPVGIEHLPLIVGLRRGAVNTGKWEDEHGTKLFLALERSGNSLGMAVSERDKFIQKAGLPVFDGSQEYCLWLGCMGAYDPQGRETITALARVLNYLGIGFGVLKKEHCSGDPARRLGNDLAFSELARWNLEQINSAGVAKMVSICPHCVRTIGQDWIEFGAHLIIEHHSELLARYAARLPGNAGGERIVFHDPCYLGRYRDIYEAPRSVASLGGAVVDPPRSRQRSFCCGAGGGRVFLGEEPGKRVSVERAEELVATGAGIVGVACPFCNTMFRDALASTTRVPPKLLDIAQIAAGSLDRAIKPPGTTQ